MRRILPLLLALLALFSAEMLLRFGRETRRESAALTALSCALAPSPTAAAPSPPSPDTPEESAPPWRYAPLAEENADFAFWLSIPGTVIDYPVMLAGEGGQYYLHRDFTGQESVCGVPFLDERCAPGDESLLIHAHNMADGSMFASLPAYEDEEYCRAHPVILLDTPAGEREFTVLAAFRTEVGGIPYRDYAGALDAERFAEYLALVRAAAIYDTGISAEPGDTLLTLSTCAYHAIDGRFVVIAAGR